MPEQKFLNTEVWCPVSGFKEKSGYVVPPHKMQLIVCTDGNLYARCVVHRAKTFIQDKHTVYKILEVSTVVRTKEKREKEGLKNGAS